MNPMPGDQGVQPGMPMAGPGQPQGAPPEQLPGQGAPGGMGQ
jgi:hypothetical protein